LGSSSSEAGSPIAFTVGTAGHVDHGKTTLVRRLTGTDTDRLEEEHRRGISIVPGYAELTLPGGRRASLVDVPGHERFVRNMVAGSTGVDAFLLVVAADDGPMPQTREHLDVLRVLGVERGVVALTKTDAVDAETAELAELETAELLEGVGIEAPIVRVSGLTGDGVPELLAALDRLASEVAAWERGTDGLARLPVDRVFVLKGVGLVATGTLWSGEIRPGDALHTPSGLRPRVRGVQNHGRPAEAARAGARTALSLVGIGAGELRAGDVLTSRPVPATRAFDARLRLLEAARVPLRHGARLRLHHGTSAVNARIRLLRGAGSELKPGGSDLARVVLDEALLMLPGDRFVLRATSPQVTVGGGRVLDPAPTGRRPDPDWLSALESGEAGRILPLALSREPWRTEGAAAEELSLVVPGLHDAPREDGEVVRLGGLYARRDTVEAARGRLLAALRERAEGSPESPELTVAEARSATGLGDRLADALLDSLAAEGALTAGESGVSLPGAGVPPELDAEAGALLGSLREAGVEPPAVGETAAARLLVRRGEAVRLGDGLLADAGVAEGVLDLIVAACREEGEITLGGLRDRLGTSRKYAQAWLEYADAAGVTRRVGDARALTRKYR